MKLLLKTTAGRTTEVDFANGTTIAQVKDSLKDEYDLASLRLCFQGKILDDAKVIDELGEGAALFIAGKKATLAKAVPAQSTATQQTSSAPSTQQTSAPAAASTNTPSTTATTTQSQAQEAPAPAPVSTPAPTTETTTAPAPTPAAAPAPAQPAVDEDLISNIAAMGFEDRELVKLALRAAYMNPDRAVDYLCSGMPKATLERLANEAAPAPAPRPNPTGNQATTTTTTSNSGPADALRQALATIPNFDQIRQVVQQNPASLPTFMQQLQQNHPNVFALVQENPQAFLELLQSNTAPTSAQGVQSAGPTSVQITPEDQVAIQELAELGGGAWDLQAAAIVYIAVNKNKEVAAAVLFEHGGLPPQLVQALLDQQQGGAGMGGDDDDDDDVEEY